MAVPDLRVFNDILLLSLCRDQAFSFPSAAQYDLPIRDRLERALLGATISTNSILYCFLPAQPNAPRFWPLLCKLPCFQAARLSARTAAVSFDVRGLHLIP